MSLISPFAGLRPVSQRAADVLAPPYDVLNSEEARTRAHGRPWSFLHISKAEIDLPEGTDPYAPEVYTRAAENGGQTTPVPTAPSPPPSGLRPTHPRNSESVGPSGANTATARRLPW